MTVKLVEEQVSLAFQTVLTTSDTESPIVVDLGAFYKEVILMVDAAEAANMAAATTIGLLVGDRDVLLEDGSGNKLITKPAASVGIHARFAVGNARQVKVILSAVPDSIFTARLQGTGRLAPIDGIPKKLTI